MMQYTQAQKRIIALLLSVFVLCGICHAQEVWNRTYFDNRPVMYFSSIINEGDDYYIAGGTRDRSGLNYTRAMLGRISYTGDLISYKTVTDSAGKNYGAFFNALIKNESNNLYYAGYSYDSVPRLLLLKQSLLTDSISVYEYYTPNTSAFQGYGILQYNSNSYYITGVRTVASLNNASVVLIKVDSNGNRIWEKYYNQYKLDQANSIIKLTNGNIMLGAMRADVNQNMDYGNTWLIEVDTGGVVQREWFDPNDSTFVAEGLKQTQDGGFVYGAQKKNRDASPPVFTATVVKMDTDFHEEWIYNGGYRSIYTGLSDLELLPDGSIIACGQQPVYGQDPTVLSGWIIKLSAAGQIIWDRAYTGINEPSVLNFLTDIDVLPDGSLIAVGQCQKTGQTPPQVGWFLKLDSNGCEIENCTVGIDEPTPKSPKGDFNSQIQIWPNPFTDDISIALTDINASAATFTLTNLTGQIVYQQTATNPPAGYTQLLKLSYLPGGVYFMEVKAEGQTSVRRIVKQ